MLQQIVEAINDESLLPVMPPASRPSYSVYSYVDKTSLSDLGKDDSTSQDESFQQISKDFYDKAILPLLERRFRQTIVDYQHLTNHLRQFLFRQTMVRFNDILKSPEHTRAWRAYQRLVLESMRDQLQDAQLINLDVQNAITQLESLLSTNLSDFSSQLEQVLVNTVQIVERLDIIHGEVKNANQGIQEIYTEVQSISGGVETLHRKFDQITGSRPEFSEQRELQSPTGEILINEYQLWQYCQKHWSVAVEWLACDGLERSLEGRGWNVAAGQVRKARRTYPNQHSAALDALLAAVNPEFASMLPTLQLNKGVVDFGVIGNSSQRSSIEISLIVMRYVEVRLDCPPWVIAEPSVFTLAPDRPQIQILLRAALPGQALQHSTALIKVQTTVATLELPVRAAIATPDGTASFYAEQKQNLVRWITALPENWRAASSWLREDATLQAILVFWGDARLAGRLRHLGIAYPDNDQFIDVALSEMVPKNEVLAVPDIQIQPQFIALAQLSVGASLRISNPSQRLAEVYIEKPDWLKLNSDSQLATHNRDRVTLRLLPGEVKMLSVGQHRVPTSAGQLTLRVGERRYEVVLRDGIVLPKSTEAPVLATEVSRLTSWALVHWEDMITWLFAWRASLPDDIERRWGDSVLANKIRQEKDRGGRSRDMILDAVLASIDPIFGQERASIEVIPPVLPAHEPGKSSEMTLRLHNIGRRHACIEVSLADGWQASSNTFQISGTMASVAYFRVPTRK